jgi:hypothetical protein
MKNTKRHENYFSKFFVNICVFRGKNKNRIKGTCLFSKLVFFLNCYPSFLMFNSEFSNPILRIEQLEEVVRGEQSALEQAWETNRRCVRRTKHSRNVLTS